MPVYSYACRSCNHEFDVFYTSQAAVKREEKSEKCPRCESKKKKRAVSKGTSFILKGNGWFKTGY
jgi:putative FmdB family regulatory protein